MEQLKHLDGRLLGKKCVATILGFWGLCCPLSLSAEKLDTTFVLDMVVDTTPCYYVKYDTYGSVTGYGRYVSPSDFDHTSHFRINTGYVTNEKGNGVETLLYACDRVTKQWVQLDQTGELTFGNNRLVRQIGSDYTSNCGQTSANPADMHCHGYGNYNKFSDQGYIKTYYYKYFDQGPRTPPSVYEEKAQYDKWGNITQYDVYGSNSVGENSTYTNRYDDNGNNIFVEKKGIKTDPNNVILEDFIISTTKKYDSLNRLIKVINETTFFSTLFDTTTIYKTDSVIYIYCQPSPFLVLTKDGFINGDSINKDKYEYDFTDSYFFSDITIIGDGVTKTYDAESSVLTIQTLDTNYTIACKKPMSYLENILVDNVPLDSFSFDKFEYNCSADYVFEQIRYHALGGTTVEKKYDAESRLLTLNVYGTDYAYDSTNMHTYSILCKKPESYLISIDTNGVLIDGFSYDKFQYDLSDIYYDETNFSCQVSAGATIEMNYNKSNAVLDILVKGCDYSNRVENSKKDNQHTYSFTFKKPTWMTSLSFGKSKVDTFSPQKYIYDFSDYYFHKFSENKKMGMYLVPNADYSANMDDYFVQWTYLGDVVDKSYDPTSGIVSVKISDRNDSKNSHTYIFLTKKRGDSLFHIGWENCETNRSGGGVAIENGKYDYDVYGDYSSACHFSYTPDFFNTEDAYINGWIADYKSDSTFTCTVVVSLPGYDTVRYHINFRKPESYLTSLEINNIPVDSFSPNRYQYDFSDSILYKEDGININNSINAKITKKFDNTTNILTITVVGSDFESDTTNMHVYTFRFMDPKSNLPSISSLSIDGEPVDSFSSDIHDYWLDREYTPDLVSYNLPKGVVATESFDDSTNILTISVRFTTESTTQPAPASSQNMALPVRHAPKDTSVTVEYRIHFRPMDGVNDFLGDQVSLYVMDKTICVDGAEEPLFVYDLLGALVGTGRVEEVRIPVPQTGVYVVRAGGKAAKVVVR
ncbi:MAG: hypothetical protein IKN77_02075 [Paludibacteraceae bacterium]|nr:hypothetical protein [Paludibacteraceae bacterium]